MLTYATYAASNLSVADVCAVASGAGDARMLEVRTATYADVAYVLA